MAARPARAVQAPTAIARTAYRQEAPMVRVSSVSNSSPMRAFSAFIVISWVRRLGVMQL
jgi:hypothetical protein